MPPSSSFIYVLDFVRTKIVLIYEIWENISDVFMFNENNNIKTNIIKICTNIREKKALSQDLNIQEVDVVTSESNANGKSKIKILISIYRIE